MKPSTATGMAFNNNNNKNNNHNNHQKKVLVIGAGLAGITAAHALVQRSRLLGLNYGVTVVDARDDVALETSFANAGRFCPTSLAKGSPAQGAGVRRTFIPDWMKSRFFQQASVDPRQPFVQHMQVNFLRPRLLYWGLCNVFLKQHEDVKLAHRLLADHAVRCMDTTLAQLPVSSLSSIARHPGTLYVYHRQEDFEEAAKKETHNVQGTNFEVDPLGTNDALRRFPWLSNWKAGVSSPNGLSDRVPGVIYVPKDWSADAREFVVALVAHAQGPEASSVVAEITPKSPAGSISFRLQTRVKRIVPAGIEIENPNGDLETIDADVVVVACGVHSSALIPQGPRLLPMEGLRGFSVDLYDCEGAPDVAVADFSSGDLNFQITPFGDDRRVRVVGFADFVGTKSMLDAASDSTDDGPTRVLTAHLRFVLPALNWSGQRATWVGLRPMTPDNLPYVGQVHINHRLGTATAVLEREKTSHDADTSNNGPAVFVCCGHGAQGWTSSCATADVLARLILPQQGSSASNSSSETFFEQEIRELTYALRPGRFEQALQSKAVWLASAVQHVLDWIL